MNRSEFPKNPENMDKEELERIFTDWLNLFNQNSEEFGLAEGHKEKIRELESLFAASLAPKDIGNPEIQKKHAELLERANEIAEFLTKEYKDKEVLNISEEFYNRETIIEFELTQLSKDERELLGNLIKNWLGLGAQMLQQLGEERYDLKSVTGLWEKYKKASHELRELIANLEETDKGPVQ